MTTTSDTSSFAGRDVWIFDLDNTLYPASCNLFAQVDVRMGAFISELLGVDATEARRVQKTYYRDHGTTLRGLMDLHGINPDEFLAFVHDIDHSTLEPDPALGKAITALPGRKLIFTNGSRKHAEMVASRIGILNAFEDIFDIAAANFVPKPNTEAYQLFLDWSGIESKRAVMLEDISRNLEAPAMLGMATVLVTPDEGDHPDEREGWVNPGAIGDHVHHVTDDLTKFLKHINAALAEAG